MEANEVEISYIGNCLDGQPHPSLPPGWYIMAEGQPFMGPFASESEALAIYQIP